MSCEVNIMGQPAKTDYYRTVADLIVNTITSAKIVGENRKLTGLVAGSVTRFVRELDNESGDEEQGDALLDFARECIEEHGAEHVPNLAAALNTLAAARA